MSQLCPTCSQPCAYKDGIMCQAYICKKKDIASGKTVADGGLDSLLNIFNIKPGDPTYQIFKNNNYTQK